MTICIAGHAGIGHVFSHAGFVQDDSQGFALASSLLCSLKGFDPKITEIKIDRENQTLTVGVTGGGKGKGYPARGITPFEEDLVKKIVGEDPCYPQRCAMKALGRLYGHGISEVPAALEYAISEALLDSFDRLFDDFLLIRRDTDQANDMAGGIKVELDCCPVVIMITVNGSNRGTGPVEDLEGNIPLDFKRTLMEKLDVINAPTIIAESKAFVPSLEGIETETFLVRYNREIDNAVVGESLEKALDEIKTTWISSDSAFPFPEGDMKKNTRKFADRLTSLSESLGNAPTSVEKSRLASEISLLVSQDLGGIIFMSNEVNDVYRSAGLSPGTSAVLSIVVPKNYIDKNIIPFTTDGNIHIMKEAVIKACSFINDEYQQAVEEIRTKKNRS
jgi:hypothetical protein